MLLVSNHDSFMMPLQGRRPVRRFAIVVLALSLPSVANAAMLTLYSPFDVTHHGQYDNGHNASPATPPVAKPPLVVGESFGGCGRGRNRDQATHRCRGPADVR